MLERHTVKLAMDISEGGSADIWLFEGARGGVTRLALDPAQDRQPVWAADGESIAFASNSADNATMNLYWQRADGTAKVERLTFDTSCRISPDELANGRQPG